MYADTYSDSMNEAIAETNRRRAIQKAYNDENGIIPTTIIKEIRPPLHNTENEINDILKTTLSGKASRKEIEYRIADLEKQMRAAAKVYDFERAAEIRDILFEMKASIGK